MSDIVKNIFSTTDKVNFLSSTNNLTNFVSRFEKFTSDNETDEERRERLCKMVIGIRVLYVLTIFISLWHANSTDKISDELFMGLSLLALAMPDIVLIIMIVMFIVNSTDTSGDNKSQSLDTTLGTTGRNKYSATSSEFSGSLKYALTSTPDVFN